MTAHDAHEGSGIDVRAVDDAVEVHVRRDVDIASEPAIARTVERVSRQRPGTIVLDFCSAHFVGVPAIRLAQKALAAVSQRGGTVIVRGRRNAQRLFRLTGTAEQVQLRDCP